jgi:hypothetical protein
LHRWRQTGQYRRRLLGRPCTGKCGCATPAQHCRDQDAASDENDFCPLRLAGPEFHKPSHFRRRDFWRAGGDTLRPRPFIKDDGLKDRSFVGRHSRVPAAFKVRVSLKSPRVAVTQRAHEEGPAGFEPAFSEQFPVPFDQVLNGNIRLRAIASASNLAASTIWATEAWNLGWDSNRTLEPELSTSALPSACCPAPQWGRLTGYLASR